MSLEVKIDALTAEVTALTKTIKSLLEIAASMPSGPLVSDLHRDADIKEETPTPAPSKPEPKTKKVKKTKPEPVDEDAPTLTAEDLKTMCIEIVREDRSKRQTIKDAIASFDGALTVDKMDPKHYSGLHAILEGLK